MKAKFWQKKSSIILLNAFIVLGSLALFFPFLGSVHLFDWDEINFAECAREMLVTGDYFSVQINFSPFWEKPPLFFWMQAVAMKALGVNEFAARLPNAVCGMATLLFLFHAGRKVVDTKFGALWALAYAASFLPQFYFKTGIIDPWFNLFVFVSFYFFILFTRSNYTVADRQAALGKLMLSAFFMGLSILTKGPVSLLIFFLALAAYGASQGFKSPLRWRHAGLYAACLALIGGLWFALQVWQGKMGMITQFFAYQFRLLRTPDAGHGGPFFYHALFLLVGCFPASVLAIKALRGNPLATPFQRHFKKWMLILFWVVLLFFSMVQTKIVHYSSLCYFPLTYLAAEAAYRILRGDLVWTKWMSYATAALAGTIGAAFTLFPLIDSAKGRLLSQRLISDKFALANLQADAGWNGWEPWLGIGFLGAVAVALLLVKFNRIGAAIVGLFASSLVTINFASVILVPKIEKYSQGSAIDFYKQFQDKDCYVEPLGFKSYAHLFYSQKMPANRIGADRDILNGPLDRPAYFVGKVNEDHSNRKKFPKLKELRRENGYVFYERKPD